MPRQIRQVAVGDRVVIGGPEPVLIMGPCVIESEAHTMKMARLVQRYADAAELPVIFKASFDKANRTSHESFRGHGLEEGLRILAAVRERTGMPVTTDVHESWQVPTVAQAVDLIQVPAFLCRQSDLIKACATCGKPTTIKKGQFLAPWDVESIIGKFRAAGGKDLVIIERGNSFGYNNLVSDFRALPIIRAMGVPVIYDGTHSVQLPGGQGNSSGGASHLAPALMRAALAVGVEGLFLETHDKPDMALSDGANMIPTRELRSFLKDVKAIHQAIGRPAPAVRG